MHVFSCSVLDTSCGMHIMGTSMKHTILTNYDIDCRDYEKLRAKYLTALRRYKLGDGPCPVPFKEQVRFFCENSVR
jgi:hypothetical protein